MAISRLFWRLPWWWHQLCLRLSDWRLVRYTDCESTFYVYKWVRGWRRQNEQCE